MSDEALTAFHATNVFSTRVCLDVEPSVPALLHVMLQCTGILIGAWMQLLILVFGTVMDIALSRPAPTACICCVLLMLVDTT